MMFKPSRRRFLGVSAAGMAVSLLPGCATTSVGTASERPLPAASSAVQLLFYADTHAQWLPVTSHPVANHLGPMSLLGQAPYFTEYNRLAELGIAVNDPRSAWLTASGARQSGGVRMGGYAALAKALEQQRGLWGADACLTLEGGQCWNGSGLAELTTGRYAPLSSHWLGAEVRIASEEQHIWPQAYPRLYAEFGRPVLDTRNPVAFFDKAGVRIAVVGVTHQPLGLSRIQYLSHIQQQVLQASAQADWVVLLSDAGTNPDLWLAKELQGVDLILSSRGQDLWPQAVQAPLPVCFAGNQGQGYYAITLESKNSKRVVSAHFHPVLADQSEASPAVAEQIQRLRSAHAGWLDQPLALAPAWLYRRDALAGSWDQLIAEALKTTGAELTLAPGLRHGLAVAPGAMITRDHLLSLTAGYNSRVFQVTADPQQLQSSLEAGADQLLSDDWYLHSSEDMPRLTGSAYVLRYQAVAGQRISELQWPVSSTRHRARVAGWSSHYRGEGQPLWQLMESWLRQRPSSWDLPPLEQPSLAFVEGHPGWHPEAVQ